MIEYTLLYLLERNKTDPLKIGKRTVRVCRDGRKEWFLNGKYHRENGPAVEYADGTKVWYLNGERHREDGPAVEYADGTKEWWLNGKLHREDGPAVECVSGAKEWWLNGELLTKEEFDNKIVD